MNENILCSHLKWLRGLIYSDLLFCQSFKHLSIFHNFSKFVFVLFKSFMVIFNAYDPFAENFTSEALLGHIIWGKSRLFLGELSYFLHTSYWKLVFLIFRKLQQFFDKIRLADLSLHGRPVSFCHAKKDESSFTECLNIYWWIAISL